MRNATINPRLRGRRAPDADSRRAAALALIERYERSLRRTARRYSLCADDADDAYQRAVEILLLKAPVLEPDRLVRWMHTVTRHEAYAVRRQRSRFDEAPVGETDGGTLVDPLELVPADGPEPAEGMVRRERIARSREALKRLKATEVKALVLKAEGYSYAEIAEITGWSRTKISRNMVEGRRRFLSAFSDIEEGRRCEQLSKHLSALADGEVPGEARSDLLEHLEQCAHCRAKLRAFRGAPRRVLEVAPIGVLAGPSAWDQMGEHAAAIVDRARELSTSVMQRGAGAMDASQTVAAGGGSRGSGLALIGVVCGIGAAGGGAAAVCVDQGVIPDPFREPQPEIQVPAVTDREPGVSEPQPSGPPEEVVEAPADSAPAGEFGIERSSSGGSTEFGGTASAGSGSGGSGAGSGGSSQGFGIEK